MHAYSYPHIHRRTSMLAVDVYLSPELPFYVTRLALFREARHGNDDARIASDCANPLWTPDDSREWSGAARSVVPTSALEAPIRCNRSLLIYITASAFAIHPA